MNIRTIELLLNELDPERLLFTERDVIDALNVLYDNNRKGEIDFDEFLYELALHSKVCCVVLLSRFIESVCQMRF